MGAYFVLGERENNTKSISFMINDIMYAVYIPELFEKIKDGDNYYFKKKHIAQFLKFTKILINDENTLKLFLKNVACEYYKNDTLDNIKWYLDWIRNCFEDILIEMILEKKKKIRGYWE